MERKEMESAHAGEREACPDVVAPPDGLASPSDLELGRTGPEAGAGWQERLPGMWKHLLRVENVESDSDFFELGGDSLRAVQLIARLSSQMDYEIPVRTLFELRRLDRMAAFLDQLSWAMQAARLPTQAEGMDPGQEQGCI